MVSACFLIFLLIIFSCTDSLDGGTPSSARKAFGSRSNTVKDLTDSPKLKPANHHRRYNTISVPPKLDVALSYVDAKDEEKNRDLKVENASLRRKLHQTKISEAGKMCKVLYENAELNRYDSYFMCLQLFCFVYLLIFLYDSFIFENIILVITIC